MAIQCLICLTADFNQFNALDCGHVLHADCLSKLQDAAEEDSFKCPICRTEFSAEDYEGTEINFNLENLTLNELQDDQLRERDEIERSYQLELEKSKMELKATCENLENALTLNIVSLNCLKYLKIQLIQESNEEMASEIGEKVYGNLLTYLKMGNPDASEDSLPPNVFQMNENAIDNYMDSYRNIRTAFAELKEIKID